jgi:hypothetical protein
MYARFPLEIPRFSLFSAFPLASALTLHADTNATRSIRRFFSAVHTTLVEQEFSKKQVLEILLSLFFFRMVGPALINSYVFEFPRNEVPTKIISVVKLIQATATRRKSSFKFVQRSFPSIRDLFDSFHARIVCICTYVAFAVCLCFPHRKRMIAVVRSVFDGPIEKPKPISSTSVELFLHKETNTATMAVLHYFEENPSVLDYLQEKVQFFKGHAELVRKKSLSHSGSQEFEFV